MTITDKWLIERAQTRRAEGNANRRLLKSDGFASAFDGGAGTLWRDLQAELTRQAGLFNDALGEKAVSVAGDADAISIESADGRKLTITLNHASRTLTEAFRNSAGATRTGRPRISFTTGPDGALTFNFGVVQHAAGSLLRRLID